LQGYCGREICKWDDVLVTKKIPMHIGLGLLGGIVARKDANQCGLARAVDCGSRWLPRTHQYGQMRCNSSARDCSAIALNHVQPTRKRETARNPSLRFKCDLDHRSNLWVVAGGFSPRLRTVSCTRQEPTQKFLFISVSWRNIEKWG
jgi:hypothetical protein